MNLISMITTSEFLWETSTSGGFVKCITVLASSLDKQTRDTICRMWRYGVTAAYLFAWIHGQDNGCHLRQNQRIRAFLCPEWTSYLIYHREIFRRWKTGYCARSTRTATDSRAFRVVEKQNTRVQDQNNRHDVE